MGEEASKETGETGAENQDQHGDVEVLAMKMGWNPDHDPESGREFKSAEQFILDSKEILDTTVKTLRSVKKQNEEVVAGMRHLKDTYQRSAKVEKARLEDKIAQLKAQRDEAIGDADKTRVHEIDSEIETTESNIAEIDESAKETPASGGEWKEHSNEWVEANPWYGKNETMTQYIDTQSERFRGLPADTYFKRLTEMAKTAFPDYFKDDTDAGDAGGEKTTKQTPKGQTVVGGQTRQTGDGGRKAKYTFNDLTDKQKKMALFFERSKVMSREEYVAEQAKIGNIQSM